MASITVPMEAADIDSPTATIKLAFENILKSRSGLGKPWTNMSSGAVTMASRSKSYIFDDVVIHLRWLDQGDRVGHCPMFTKNGMLRSVLCLEPQAMLMTSLYRGLLGTPRNCGGGRPSVGLVQGCEVMVMPKRARVVSCFFFHKPVFAVCFPHVSSSGASTTMQTEADLSNRDRD